MYSYGDILLTEIGLLTLGKTDSNNVNEFHSDLKYYKIAMIFVFAKL